MSEKQSPGSVASMPHMEWTARIHPKFGEKSPMEAIQAIGNRVLRTCDSRNRNLLKIADADARVLPDISRILEQYDTSSTTLMQIGAHNGEFDDPFVSRITTNNWRAILVEPQKLPYQGLAERYKDNPRVKLYNVAITDEGNEEAITLWRAVIPDNEDFGSAIAATSLKQVRAEVRRCIGPVALLNTTYTSEEFQAVTLAQLFRDDLISPEEVTIFGCDTEGLDGRIVKSLIQDVGVRPPVIQWEHLHVEPTMASEVDRNLKELGYDTIKTHKDSFAYLD